MKSITYSLTLILLLFAFNFGYSQKVAVIVINHTNPDGFAFVALEDIASSMVINFSEDEYNNSTNILFHHNV